MGWIKEIGLFVPAKSVEHMQRNALIMLSAGLNTGRCDICVAFFCCFLHKRFKNVLFGTNMTDCFGEYTLTCDEWPQSENMENEKRERLPRHFWFYFKIKACHIYYLCSKLNGAFYAGFDLYVNVV